MCLKIAEFKKKNVFVLYLIASLFNGISIFEGYFMPKPFFEMKTNGTIYQPLRSGRI